jgi:hypothetical protein
MRRPAISTLPIFRTIIEMTALLLVHCYYRFKLSDIMEQDHITVAVIPKVQ